MRTKLTDRESIDIILQEMTLEEKLTLLTGDTTFRGGKNEEHGISAPLLLDGGTGFNSRQMMLDSLFIAKERLEGRIDPETLKEPLEAFGISTTLRGKLAREDNADQHTKEIGKLAQKLTDEIRPKDGRLGCYPPGMLLGATMNPQVVYQCGEAVGREASACHIDVLLGSPNVNLHRDPKNGRLFEGYSEDPCVVSTLAPEFVKGVQSTGVAANVKHYAANNQETDRMGVNEIISERALQELYLPGFKACVKAGCKTVMTAYNKINGIPCAQNPYLLKKMLREEWGFQGFVVSDWGAVYDRTEALKAGNDVTMPGPREIGSLKKSYKEGILTMEEIDGACRNYLQVLLEMPIMQGRKYESIDLDHSMKAAYRSAAEGITLLKNDGILPLSENSRVAFFGEKSRKFNECGTGSASVSTVLSTNLFDCSGEIVGKDNTAYGEMDEHTDAVIVTVGASSGEGADRQQMSMEEADRRILKEAIEKAKVLSKPVVLVLNVSGPIELMEFVEDVAAVLCVYLPGMGGGKAAADILFGRVNPSGKLPLTFPKYYRDAPTFGNFPGEYQTVNYGEGIYVGYRYYDTKNVKPLFPFGHGLSYTTFELSDISVEDRINIEENTVGISLKIRNTGDRAGAETVQLYISDKQSTLARPEKELKRFCKVFLEPGESKEVTFELAKEDFAYYDTRLGKFITEPGEFELLAGTSSRNIAAVKTIWLEGNSPYGISEKTEIAKLVTNSRAVAVIHKYLPDLNMMEAAGLYIVFLPFTSFEDVWNKSIKQDIHDKTDEEINVIYHHVLEDFAALGGV